MAMLLGRQNGAHELAEFLTRALEVFVRTSDTAATEATAAWSRIEEELVRRAEAAEIRAGAAEVRARAAEERAGAAEVRAETAEKLASSSYDDGWVAALQHGCKVADTACRQRHLGAALPATDEVLVLGRESEYTAKVTDCFHKVVRVSTDGQDTRKQAEDVESWVEDFTKDISGRQRVVDMRGGEPVHASAWQADAGEHMPYWYGEAVETQKGVEAGTQCYLVVRQVSRLSRDFDSGMLAARLLVEAGWVIVVCGQKALVGMTPWQQFASLLASSAVSSSEKSLDAFMRSTSTNNKKYF